MNSTTPKWDFVSIRIAPELFERIRTRAEHNERSLNKEVTFILKDYFSQQAEESQHQPAPR